MSSPFAFMEILNKLEGQSPFSQGTFSNGDRYKLYSYSGQDALLYFDVHEDRYTRILIGYMTKDIPKQLSNIGVISINSEYKFVAHHESELSIFYNNTSAFALNGKHFYFNSPEEFISYRKKLDIKKEMNQRISK